MSEATKTPTNIPETTPDIGAFEGGSFSITHLASDPRGFQIETSSQLRRREDQNQPFLDEDQKNTLTNGIGREIEFQGGGSVREARQKLRAAELNGAPESVIDTLHEDFNTKRQDYIKGMAGKVGVRNVEVSENVMTVDAKSIPFPAYTGLSKPENSKEVLDFSEVTATAMAVRTADGRLVIQHRAVATQRIDSETLSRGNAVYPDVPGASVAGMLDATIESKDRSAGQPDKVDTEFVVNGILKEADEELGVDANDLAGIRIVGFAHDNIKPHDEFLMLADSTLSSEELRSKSRQAVRSRHLGDADFEEKFVDIEASPEAIETLLCDVQCPMPSTHAAVMVASGYSMMLEAEGIEAADSWKDRLESQIQENVIRIDQRVADFYKQHPEALHKVPERYWDKDVPARNPQGYSPLYTPNEQGLPNFEDEMVRVGLMPETRKRVDEAYLFDVDGPLSDPLEHKVTELELLDNIASKLDNGVPVGLNTGRSTEWAIEKFVNLMAEKLQDQSSLKNLVVIGEMGGTWATFDDEGKPTLNRSKQLTIPDNIRSSLTKIIEEEHSDLMYLDNAKHSMCSVTMREGSDLVAFDERRAKLNETIDQLVAESSDANRLHVGNTTIAIDINVKYAGKDLGAERFQEWLKANNIKPDSFITFGDSSSDIEMAEELDRNGENVTFVFVGPEDFIPDGNPAYPIVNRPGYSQATLQYLKAQ